ncbi:tetratricopeptide repeat protein [Myxococcota bacterium]
MGEKTQVIKDKASKFAKKGQNKKAIKEYEKLLERKSGEPRTLHRLAELWARENAKTKAIDMFLQAAEGYSQAGFADRSVAVLKQALSLDATRLDVNLRLADQYVKKGFERDAVYHLIKASSVFDKAGNEKKQLQVLQKAVELAPGDVDAHMHLARLHVKAGRQNDARGEFVHAAEELKKAGRMDEFATIAEKAIELGEVDPGLHHSLAECYLSRKECEKALLILDRQMQVRSDDLRSLELTAEAHMGMDRPTRAVGVLKRLVRLARRKGEEERAEAALDTLADISPGSSITDPRGGPKPVPPVPPPPVEAQPPPVATLDESAFEDEDTAPGSVTLVPPDLTVEEDEVWGDQTTPYTIQPDEQTMMVAIDDVLSQVGDEIYPDGRRPSIDPAENEDFQEALKETDFYIGQGLLDEAEEMLHGLADEYPGNREIADRLGEIMRLRGIEFEDTESLF